jgi:hypothetical protein
MGTNPLLNSRRVVAADKNLNEVNARNAHKILILNSFWRTRQNSNL